MKTESINYKGWTDCVRITNDVIEMIVTKQVGPRIIRFGFVGGKNLFYESPDQVGTTGGNAWKIYGGHRLWSAPEDKESTYIADNSPIQHECGINYARFAAPVEAAGIQKVIEISLTDEPNRVILNHKMINRGISDLYLAPWAISVMRAAGVAIIPHNLGLPDQLQPTHSIAIWNYTRLTDPRLVFSDHFIFVRQDPAIARALKIGVNNRCGWAGYAVSDMLFVKRFRWDSDITYPDLNCNFESFTNDEILEMESLGAVKRLQPGESAEHQEEWELYADVPMPSSEEEVQRYILPIVENSK